jgi:hypothetical protein
MEKVLRKLAEDLRERGKLDLTEPYIDGTHAPAKKGGLEVGKTRAGKATKTMAVADRNQDIKPTSENPSLSQIPQAAKDLVAELGLHKGNGVDFLAGKTSGESSGKRSIEDVGLAAQQRLETTPDSYKTKDGKKDLRKSFDGYVASHPGATAETFAAEQASKLGADPGVIEDLITQMEPEKAKGNPKLG